MNSNDPNNYDDTVKKISINFQLTFSDITQCRKKWRWTWRARWKLSTAKKKKQKPHFWARDKIINIFSRDKITSVKCFCRFTHTIEAARNDVTNVILKIVSLKFLVKRLQFLLQSDWHFTDKKFWRFQIKLIVDCDRFLNVQVHW